MMPFDQNDFAASVVPLMLGHPMTNRAVPRLKRLPLEFEASGSFRHVRSGLRADTDGQMRFLGAKDPRLTELPGSLGVLDGEGRFPLG